MSRTWTMVLVALDGLGRSVKPTALILSSLAGGDKHGYALIEDITGFAGQTLGPGTLDGADPVAGSAGWCKRWPSRNDDALID